MHHRIAKSARNLYCILLRQSWVCAAQEDGILDRAGFPCPLHRAISRPIPSHPIPSHPIPPDLHDAPSKCLTSCRRGAVWYGAGSGAKLRRGLDLLTVKVRGVEDSGWTALLRVSCSSPLSRTKQASKQASKQTLKSIPSPISDCTR